MSSVFFDDDYHRLLEPFHPEEEARRETASIRELLGLAQDDRILDLGCGWGRHLTLLREAGHDVTGVDLSLPLLRRIPGRGSDGPAPVVAGDMLHLPFRDTAFDTVLNLATSLGLFLDDGPAVAALREARRVLRPEGRLLIEGMHRDDVVARYASHDEWTLDDGTEVRARRRFDAIAGVSHEVLRWGVPDPAHTPGRAGSRGGVKRHSLRLRTATEVVGLIGAAGLTVEGVFGGWDGERFGWESDRLVVVTSAGSGQGGEASVG